MRLLIVQFAGDYRQAVDNFRAGQSEMYYAQKYSVDSVAALTERVPHVTVLCCTTSTVYDELLPNGVRAIGAGLPPSLPRKPLLKLIAAQNPTHLVLDLQIREVLRWAIQQQVPTITLFSGSLRQQNWRDRLRNLLVARLLKHRQIEWVGSYGINSSLRLQQLGVAAEKIIPWDFIIETTPGSLEPKPQPATDRPWTLFYVGSMIEGKGVGDILRAVAHLKAQGVAVKARLAGLDSNGVYAKQAAELEIADRIEFLGLIPTSRVEPLMHEADVVLIPSRHSYTEGFPLTIHHGLKSRTPIVASDHPMFRGKLTPGQSALIFPAGNAIALANCIQQLRQDAQLYCRLSDAAYDTWLKLRLPTKWADVIEHWLEPYLEDASGSATEKVLTAKQWFAERCLSSKIYDHRRSLPTAESPAKGALVEKSDLTVESQSVTEV